MVKYGKPLVVDAVMCWGSFPGACNVNMKKFEKVYTDMGMGHDVKLEREGMHRGFNTRTAFMSAFGGVEAKTLLISNAFYALVNSVERKEEWAWVYKKGVLPFPQLATCQSSIVPQPNSAIMRSAQLLIQSKPELRAREYLAVHMRRGDFKSKFPYLRPVAQIAAHVKRVAQEWGVSTVVLLTDGSTYEVGS